MLITFDIQNLIDAAFSEDVLTGDPTTDVLIPPGSDGAGCAGHARCHGVLAGIEVATAAFERFDPSLRTKILTLDGSSVSPGDRLAQVRAAWRPY